MTLDQLVRPYPQVVAGTPESWAYADGTFSARWATGGAKGDSEIVIPARAYPEGYSAQVLGGSITSKKGDRLLRVAACRGVPEVAVPSPGPPTRHARPASRRRCWCA